MGASVFIYEGDETITGGERTDFILMPGVRDRLGLQASTWRTCKRPERGLAAIGLKLGSRFVRLRKGLVWRWTACGALSDWRINW